MHAQPGLALRIAPDILQHEPYGLGENCVTAAYQPRHGVRRKPDLLGHIKGDQGDRYSGGEYHVRGVRVDKHVEFGYSRDIARDRDGTAHDNQTTELLHGFRGLPDGLGEIGERPEGNHRKFLAIRADRGEEALDGLPLRCVVGWQGIARRAVGLLVLCEAAEAVGVMECRGRLQGTAQRACRPLRDDRPVAGIEQGDKTARVVRGRLHRHVSGHGGDKLDLQLR